MPDNANQTTVFINNDMELKPGFFTSIDNEAWEEAAILLQCGVGFFFWLYLCGNQDGKRKDIYSSDVIAKTGIDRTSFYNARSDLIDYGFLIKSPNDSYSYEFFTKTPISKSWLNCIPKSRKKRGQEPELKKEYNKLMKKGIKVEDFTLEELWLYNRGKKYSWKVDWEF